jgi:hypothetical protein
MKKQKGPSWGPPGGMSNGQGGGAQMVESVLVLHGVVRSWLCET